MRSLLLLSVTFTLACGGASNPPPSTTPAPTADGSDAASAQPGACITTGCSGGVCAEAGKDVITTCEYRAEYACYQKAACEKQADGTCGWTQTAELTSCLASPPPM